MPPLPHPQPPPPPPPPKSGIASPKSLALLRRLAALPTPSAAWHTSANGQWHVQLAQKDLPSNKAHSFVRSYTDAGALAGLAHPVHPDVVLYAVAPDGTALSIRKRDKAHVVEAFRPAEGRAFATEVAAATHGAVYAAGSTFESSAFSADGRAFVYTAEAPQDEQPKVVASHPSIDTPDEDGAMTWRPTPPFAQSWGEASGKAVQPTLFVVDMGAGTVRRVEGVPGDHSAGQAIFDAASNDSSLVFTAWEHGGGNKLGIAHCFNRRSRIMRVALEGGGEATEVACVRGSATSPALTPDNKTLVFLSHADTLEQGVHMADATLHTLPWPPSSGEGPSPTQVALSGAVEHLYVASNRIRPFNFAPSSDRLVLSAHVRSSVALVEVSLASGRTGVVPCPSTAGLAVPADAAGDDLAICECTLLARSDRSWLVRISDPLTPPTIAQLSRGDDGAWAWQRMGDERQRANGVPRPEGARWAAVAIPGEDGGAAVGASVVACPPGKPVGAVLIPHGGPHTTSTAQFFAAARAFLARGFVVCLPNYRGSLGFGRNLQMALPGQCGRVDVRDCMSALDASLSWAVGEEEASSLKRAVWGGSHGGFLASHLIGQHPDAFAAAVMRNPVINLVSMASTTDIPDWCSVECFGAPAPGPSMRMPDGTFPPGPEALARLHAASPIAHAHAIRAPVLLLIGADDLRVPQEQGHQLRRVLEADGKTCETFEYAGEGHALGKPQTEFECLAHSIRFIERHLAVDGE